MNDVFWFGKVIAKDDEKKSNQLKVHIYNETDDLSDDEQLWCLTASPITSFGHETVSVPIGALVYGIYADNQHKRNPIVLGQVNVNGESVDYLGINTVRNGNASKSNEISKLRNDNTWGFSNPLFGVNDRNAIEQTERKYPNCHSVQTEQGLLFEYNDDKENGYITVRDNQGNYIEQDKNGITVYSNKPVKIVSKEHGYICSVNDTNIHAGNNVNIYGNSVNVHASKFNVNSQSYTVNSNTVNYNCSDVFKVNAGLIKLN